MNYPKEINYPEEMFYAENLPKLAEQMNRQAELDEGYRDVYAAYDNAISKLTADGYALRAKRLREAAAALVQPNTNADNETATFSETLPLINCSPKIIQLLLTPNDSNWQGMLLGLADNGDTYRLDHADGWAIWFDGISKENS